MVHHVELNKTGWLDHAVEQMILVTLFEAGTPIAIQGILAALEEAMGMMPEVDRIERLLERLAMNGDIVTDTEERSGLSQKSRSTLEKVFAEALETQKRLEDFFAVTLKSRCPELDSTTTWRTVNEHLLLPTIRALGARTYELVFGNTFNVEKFPNSKNFFARYVNPHQRNQLSEVLPVDWTTWDLI